jgi:hypothetical protein
MPRNVGYTGHVRVVQRGMNDPNARCCPSGHNLRRTLRIHRHQATGSIRCDSCNTNIQEDYIAGSCIECDIDFCESCFQSGRSVEEMVATGQQSMQRPQVRQVCCMVVTLQAADPVTAAARGERYNDRRPHYHGRRIDALAYPDPTIFGWTFTGSCEGGRAEFFQKDFAEHGVVKLDFYYTTGTVKTVLDHPRQGVTQLFAKGSALSPEMYRQILLQPRVHTDVRYRRRS